MPASASATTSPAHPGSTSLLLAHTQPHTVRQRLRQQPDALIVACYCAAWCKTCSGYQRDFAALAQRAADHVFVWIDIEESTQLLGDDDIENFPTLLLQRQGQTLFFGVQQPFISHLENLLRRSDRLVPVEGHKPLAELIERLELP